MDSFNNFQMEGNSASDGARFAMPPRQLDEVRSLRKANSMRLKGGDLNWDESDLGLGGSPLRSFQKLEETKVTGFHPLDLDTPSQVNRMKLQSKGLRGFASTSHLFRGSSHVDNKSSMQDILDKVDRLSMSERERRWDSFDAQSQYSEILDSDAGPPVGHRSKLNQVNGMMNRTQSMRYPPGFDKFGPSSGHDIDATLQQFKEAQLDQNKQLKRFVTFAGNLSSQADNDFGVPIQQHVSYDDLSDGEDEDDVAVVDDIGLSNMVGLGSISKPPRSPENMGTPGELKRIDSAQRMRKAFPKTMFDNVDTPSIPTGVVRRINSARSIKSSNSVGSSSTTASLSNKMPQQRAEKSSPLANDFMSSPPQQQYPSERPAERYYHDSAGLNNQQGYGYQASMNQNGLGGFPPGSPTNMYNDYGSFPTSPTNNIYMDRGSPSPIPFMGGQPNMQYQNMPRNQGSPTNLPPGAGFGGPAGNVSPEFLQYAMRNQAVVNMLLQQSAYQQQMLQSMAGQNMMRGSPYSENKKNQMNVMQNNFKDAKSPGGGYGEAGISSLLIRHKSSGYRPSIPELAGHVIEFSRDSHGSRLIQCLMESAPAEEKEMLINEVINQGVSLMQDLFGNYVMQNFLEHSNEGQRNELARQIKESMNLLSFQPHGCRVVQKAIDILPTAQRNGLLKEILYPVQNINQCAKDPHATHVLQRAVVQLQNEIRIAKKSPPTGEREKALHKENLELLEAIENSVSAEVLELAVDSHACRLIQRTLGDCDYNRSKHVANMIETVRKVYPTLALHQHGNFILQHLLDKGNPEQQDEVQQFVCSRFLELAQHKFGSHLVEKCLNAANRHQADKLVKELLAPALHLRKTKGVKNGEDDILMALMKDPYANFVVQRAFDASQGELRNQIIREVQDRSDVLSRFTYGRHILSHVNKTDA